MTKTSDIHQEGAVVHGNNVTTIGDATIGHIGDMFNIASAYFNFSDKVSEVLLKEVLRDAQGDYTAEKLSRKGDWEPETVLVPAGPFPMGSKRGDGIPEYETTQFEMTLPAYRIGKYPVTNRQFVRFVEEFTEIGLPPAAWGWTEGNRPKDEAFDHPIKGVTWYEALAYCAWLSKETGRPYTLPSEAQWEKAARGEQGLLFPWGNDWHDGQYCNTNHKQLASIYKYDQPGMISPYGCVDMVGNMREWTTTLWGRNRLHNLELESAYPWRSKDSWQANNHQDRLKINRQIRRVTRGGTALLAHIPLRAARRQSELPSWRGARDNRIGFRVILNWEGQHVE